MVGANPRARCLSDSVVAQFLEHRLPSEQRAAVEAHVDGCASCRRILIDVISELQPSSAAAEAHTTHPARIAGSADALAKGTVVGRFVVLEFLGAGGMGMVYTAYDPELDRKVALKLLRPGVRDAGGTRALLVEAQAMARISHANVIAVYDVGTYRDQVFAAVELVEGATLRRWLAERRRSWREVVDVFVLAGEGLAAAHAAGVVHRDFKPENVLIGGDGRVKVSDFGLAAEPSAPTTQVAGTPGYLAVEAFQPGRFDERADQFSFCVALHEALHGSRPFSARTLDDLVSEVRRGPAEGASRDVPGRLNRVVRRGLQLAPADRYPSMRAVIAELRRVVVARRMRRLAAAAVGTLAVVIGATAIVVGTRETQPPPCAGAMAQLAGVWDAARRDAVRARFVATAPGAGAAFARVAAALDRYAADWAVVRTEACEATELRGEQSPAVRDLRMACLDRARIQLRALGDALVAADAGVVRDAAAAAAALPPLDACSDPEALRAIVSPPLAAAPRTPLAAAAIAEPEAPVVPAQPDESEHLARPDFRLPFGCGEAWQLVPARAPAETEVDFALPDDEPSAGAAVFASAPGWVSRLAPDNGEVVLNHGNGWFSSYQHMTDVAVARHQYVGRGYVIGRVGNVGVANSLGGPGRAHLRYLQFYQRGVASFDPAHAAGRRRPRLEGVALAASAGARIWTSTNNCASAGATSGAVQFDVPAAPTVFSRSRPTMEIMTRRLRDHRLFERWYAAGWNAAPMPHTIVGRPAVAVFEGQLHVVARKSDGTIFDFHYSPFTGWKTTYLEGRATGDPDIVVHGWDRNLHVAARGPDGYLYQWWTVNGGWTRPVQVGNTPMVGTPALFSHFDALYIVARGPDDVLWSWQTDRRRSWRGWTLHGEVADNPEISVDPQSRRVNVLARGVDGRLYRWQADEVGRTAGRAGAGWSEPEQIDPDAVAGAPAATIYRGAMHVVARGRDNLVHHWWKDASWHHATIGGRYTSDPAVLPFDGQLQTVGRGSNGNLFTIWYDPVSDIWSVEDQDVEIAE